MSKPFDDNNFITSLAHIVENYPQLIAVSELDGESLSYEALWQRASFVSIALQRANCDKNQLIAIQISKSCDFVVAIVGVWLAGCAFTVLDPSQPESRLVLMCEEAKPDFILYGRDSAPAWLGAKQLCIKDVINRSFDSAEFVRSKDNCKHGFSSDDLAYVLFTSGSSGKPKGVRVAHKGVLSVLQAQIKMFNLSAGQKSLWLHSIAFDASISDIGTALLSASQLVIIVDYTPTSPRRLMAYIEQLQINFVDIPPALLQWIDPKQSPKSLQTLVVGGEVCAVETLRRWAKYKRVILVYGPTEATICTSMAVVDPDRWSSNGIGKPLAHIEYLVSSPPGEPDNEGELFIGGKAVALGYLNQPELESKKFVYIKQRRYYATGDKVRQRSDKSFEFLGRTDRQVKVNGKLVAPEEVESCLISHALVKQVAVVPLTNSGKTRLVAFFEAVDNQVEVTLNGIEHSLRTFLEQQLAAWMIPSIFCRLDKIPLNQNQKVDLKYLTAMAQQQHTNHETEVGTSWIDEVQQLFTQALGYKPSDLDDDIFQLGIDSMSIVSLLSLAESKGLPLTAQMLYQYRNINRIIEQLASNNKRYSGLSSVKLHEEALAQIAEIPPRKPQTTDHQTCAGNILLTGVTGFFGSMVLSELLKQTQKVVYCLIRGKTFEMKSRLLEAMSQHGLTINEQEWQRVYLINGDLQQPLFGWSNEQWQYYANSIEAIYHCAADTSIIKPYEALKSSNVQSTRTIIEFAMARQNKVLHYISTLSVFVDAIPKPTMCLESDKLEEAVEVFGGYAQTKWVAEKMLHLYAANFTGLSIYRLGLLTAKLQGGQAPKNDWFSLIVKYGAKAFDKDLEKALLFDFTPVDFAAKALVYIANNSTQPKSVFHIANPCPVSVRVLSEAMKQEFDLTRLNDNTAVYINRFLDEELNAGLKDQIEHSPIRLFKRTATDFDMTNSHDLLAPVNIKVPKIDVNYLKQYRMKVMEMD